MNQLHIVTVGISLLTNFAKVNSLPLEKVLRLHQQLAGFLKADPRAACSEINSIDARTGLLRRKSKGLAVTLVYSATAGQESRLAARLIGNFLKLRGVAVSDIKLKDIGVPANPQADPAQAARLAEAGLIQLYDKLERMCGSCGSFIPAWRSPSTPPAATKPRRQFCMASAASWACRSIICTKPTVCPSPSPSAPCRFEDGLPRLAS